MPKRFYPLLIVLALLALALAFLPVHGEEKIYDTVVRLHVLANSDSEEDQALKLKVRDGVLAAAEPILTGVTTREEAIARLTEAMPRLEEAAAAVITAAGRNDPVAVTLGEESYPTRVYESCAFPAGTYVSLRVCIGEAAGKNWWCVLFPPLCLSSATKEAEDAFVDVGLSKEQYGIITETGKARYRVRFKILELVESWFG